MPKATLSAVRVSLSPNITQSQPLHIHRIRSNSMAADKQHGADACEAKTTHLVPARILRSSLFTTGYTTVCWHFRCGSICAREHFSRFLYPCGFRRVRQRSAESPLRGRYQDGGPNSKLVHEMAPRISHINYSKVVGSDPSHQKG